MWLYCHHTASDIIDLDHQSGRWRPVAESEKPPGARVLADLPVRGSYTVEDGKRYCSYWTDDETFVFRTPEDHVFAICSKSPDGSIKLLSPGLHCEISPATYADGRLRQGLSHVRLLDGQGQVLHELVYDSGRYLRLYAADFTAASMVQDLSDWDFFVALAGGIDIFADRAASGRVELTLTGDGSAVIEGQRMASDDLVYVDSGKPCPKPGVWACIEDLRRSVRVEDRATMPLLEGRSVCWVWARDR